MVEVVDAGDVSVSDWRRYYDLRQPLIYIAGPYSAPIKKAVQKNIDHACTERDKLVAAGWSVICPHANTAHMDNSNPGTFYKMDLTMLARCDAIYVLKGYAQSIGARMELEAALAWGLRIYFELEDGHVPNPAEPAEVLE